MKHFIEIYDMETGVMVAKVGGKDPAESTTRALKLVQSAEKPGWLLFVDQKGASARHLAKGTAK